MYLLQMVQQFVVVYAPCTCTERCGVIGFSVPVCPGGVGKDDPPQLPAMNFGGAKNFTVNINYGK